MNLSQRPFAVTAVAWIFIAVGTVTFLFHSPGLLHPQLEDFLVEFTELLALFAGIYMLRRQNWARWLALAWMVFHVGLSAFPPFKGLIVHLVIFGGMAWILVRPESAEYFRGSRSDSL